MSGPQALIAGGVLSAIAALAHLGCIVFGASWYRFFGAGERMIRLSDAGSPIPTLVTLAIAGALFTWSAYALSAAGVIARLPLLRIVLVLITAAYLVRGLVFMPLMSHFPGNSLAFWLWSSAICTAIGALHAIGLWRLWPTLSR